MANIDDLIKQALAKNGKTPTATSTANNTSAPKGDIDTHIQNALAKNAGISTPPKSAQSSNPLTSDLDTQIQRNIAAAKGEAFPTPTFDYGKLTSWLDGAYNSLMSMDGYLTRNNGKTPEDATPWDDQTNARYSEWVTRLTNQANDYLGQLKAIGDDSNQAVIQSYIDYMQGTQDTEGNPTSVGIKQFLDRERQANTVATYDTKEEEYAARAAEILNKYQNSDQVLAKGKGYTDNAGRQWTTEEIVARRNAIKGEIEQAQATLDATWQEARKLDPESNDPRLRAYRDAYKRLNDLKDEEYNLNMATDHSVDQELAWEHERNARNMGTQGDANAIDVNGNPLLAEGSAAKQKALDDWNALLQEFGDTDRKEDTLEYVNGGDRLLKNRADKTYKDTGMGEFNANRVLGRIGQDSGKAWYQYMQSGDETDLEYALAKDGLANQFIMDNQAALNHDGKLSWLTEDVAQYLPQFRDQTGAQIKGGLIGGVLGLATGAGAIAGAKAGAVAGSGVESFKEMGGQAFKALVTSGVDFDIAKKAATDEAVVSGTIEAADTLVDLLTLGGGKLLSAIGKDGLVTAIKSIGTNAATKIGASKLLAWGFELGKYGINVLGEGEQERIQGAISVVNQNRLKNNENVNMWTLAKEGAQLYLDNLFGGIGDNNVLGVTNQDELDAINADLREQARGGRTIGAVMGAASPTGLNILNGAKQGIQNAATAVFDTSPLANPNATVTPEANTVTPIAQTPTNATENAVNGTMNTQAVANNATPTETPINAPTSNDTVQPSNDTPVATQANTESLTAGISDNTQNTQNVTANNKANPFTHTTIDGDGRERVHGFSQPVDSMEAELHKSLEDDAQTYKQKTNAKTMEKAVAIINKGYKDALDDVKGALWSAEHDNKKLAPEIVPCVRILANQMVKDGDIDGARTLIKRLSTQLTEAGQLGQAARIIRNVTMGDYFGEAGNVAVFNSASVRLEFIQNVIESYNKQLTRWQVGKISSDEVSPGNKALLVNAKESIKSAIRGDYEAAKDVIMPPKELLAEYANATTDEASNAAIDNIMQYVADKTPTTFMGKFNALRYLNMLGNLKTQVRNLAGNTVMGEVAKIKRRVQATLNYALTGEQTQAIFVDSKAKKVARDYSVKFMDDMMDGGKYSDYKQAGMRKGDFARGVSEKQRVFDSNLLEAWRKATDYAMTKGDEVFISATFGDAFAGYLQSHGVKLTSEADIDALPAELRTDALEYAMKEASEATFHDNNVVSNALSNARFNSGHKVADGIANALLDGMIPFRKTPANVLVRAEEYSPLGIINTAIKAAQVASGKEGASVNDVVNSLSKSLTGTGILAAGMAMAAQGLAKGASGDDDEAEKYESQIEGKTDYSVKIGNKWVTADWVAPASIPFFMGAELYEILKDGWTPESATKLLGAVTDPMLEMSMLSGVNDAMSNLSSWGEDSDAMPKFLVSLGISYLSQAVGNTLLGQIESSLTPNRQETVYDKDSPFTRSTQMAIGKVANKIPGIDFQQEDYIDAWGNKQSNYTDKASQRWNAAENILSPAYTKSENVTEFDNELMRLHTALSKTDFEGDVLPEHTARSTKVGDTVLSNEEYTVYATKRGQESRRLLEDFLDSDVYNNLSDEERGEVIKGLLGMAKESAKADVMAMRGEKFDGTYTDVQGIDNPAEYLALKYKYNKAVKEDDYSAIDALVKASYSNKTAKLAAEKLDGYSKIKAAAAKGINAKTWFAAKDTFNKQNSNKDIKKSQADTNYKALIDSAPAFKGLTDKQKQYLKDEHPMFQMTPVNDDKYYTLKDKDLPETVIAAVISQKADMPSQDSYKSNADYQNALLNVLSGVSDNFEEDRKIIGAYTSSQTGQANFTNWLLYESGYTDEQQETLWDDFMASQGKTRTWKSAKRKYG